MSRSLRGMGITVAKPVVTKVQENGCGGMRRGERERVEPEKDSEWEDKTPRDLVER